MPAPPPATWRPPAPLTVADTDGPDHDAAQRGDSSNGNASSDQHHHPVVEADAGRAAELGPAGRRQGDVAWWPGLKPGPVLPKCPGAADSSPTSSVLGLVHTGTQRKGPGQEERAACWTLRSPAPSRIPQMQPLSRARREVEEGFKTTQSLFPPMSLTPNQEYLLPGPQTMWPELPLGGFLTCRDAYGHGCRFWITITATPLAILSVKLMAP